MTAPRRAALALAFALIAMPAAAQAPADAFDAHWRAATHALVAFCNITVTPGDTYAAERDSLSADLGWLANANPDRPLMLAQWELFPAYEEALSAMTIIVDARNNNDRASEAAGWATLHDATDAIRAALDSSESVHA